MHKGDNILFSIVWSLYQMSEEMQSISEQEWRIALFPISISIQFGLD